MENSDDEFADLSSRLLKRNKKQEGNGNASHTAEEKCRVARKTKRTAKAGPPDKPPSVQPHSPSGHRPESRGVLGQQSDEALARAIQKILDMEGTEDGGQSLEGLFCHICQKDLSAMNCTRRAQHINRCLDQSEAKPAIPGCPICGRRFTSLKSRAAHLKSCATAMAVPTSALIEAVQQQAKERLSGGTREGLTGGQVKRKGTTGIRRPTKKMKRKEEPMDENTMVALALSRSLMEQDMAPAIDGQLPTTKLWKPLDSADKKPRKKRPAAAAPPPLLLTRDPEEAFRRIQERATALLLRERAQINSTPPLPASHVSWDHGKSRLWDRSALSGHGGLQDFYTTTLLPAVRPWSSVQRQTEDDVKGAGGSDASAECGVAPATGLGGPEGLVTDPPYPFAHQTVCASQSSQSQQALRDLMELAEEGLSLSQGDPSVFARRLGASSGSSGRDAGPSVKLTSHPGASCARRGSQDLLALRKLASDLGGMINNPQLSDVQFQTDCGGLLFGHLFLLYARCPKLVEAVNEDGFLVEEEGLPQSRRLLLSGVSVDAMRDFLAYLYTAQVSIGRTTLDELRGLAVRFGVDDLLDLCAALAAGGGDDDDEEEEVVVPEVSMHEEEDEEPRRDCECGEENFRELLRSMWVNDDDDDDDRESCDLYGRPKPDTITEEEDHRDNERVNDEELEEIYEFALTQRKTMGTLAVSDEEDGVPSKICEGNEEPRQGKSPAENELRLLTLELSLSLEDGCQGPSGHIQPSPEEGLCRLTSAEVSLAGANRSSSGGADGDQSHEGPVQESSRSEARDKFSSRTPARPGEDSMPGSRASSLVDLSGGSPLSLPVLGLSPVTPPKPGERSAAAKTRIGDSPVMPTNTRVPLFSICSSPVTKAKPPSNTEGPPSPLRFKLGCPTSPIASRGMRSTWSLSVPSEDEVIVLSDSDEEAEDGKERQGSKSNSPVLKVQQRDDESRSTWTPERPQAGVWMRESQSGSRRSGATDASLGDNTSVDTSWLIPATPVPTTARAVQWSARAPSLLKSSADVTGHGSVWARGCEVGRECPVQQSPSGDHLDTNNGSSCGTSEGRHITNVTLGSRATLAESRRTMNSSSIGEDEGPAGCKNCHASESPEVFEADCDNDGRWQTCGEAQAESPPVQNAMEEADESFCLIGEPPLPFDDDGGWDASEGLGNVDDGTPSSRYSEEERVGALGVRRSPARGDARLWEEESSPVLLPLSQRLAASAPNQLLKMPAVVKKSVPRGAVVPITPMPAYAHMETPELKAQLGRFGVRPLPKRQMILKLREIHQYTHQVVSSDSEDEAVARRPTARSHAPPNPPPLGEGQRPTSTQEQGHPETESESLAPSQASHSDESFSSQRSNPEALEPSDDDDDDEAVPPSQVAAREAEKMAAVKKLILSNPDLHRQVLLYEPLVLCQLQAHLKEAGVRLGAAKLLDFLDSHCITFTTAKPHRRQRGTKKSKGPLPKKGGRAVS
ncbi:SLX4 endonuclease, partial [Polypterus senegalus]